MTFIPADIVAGVNSLLSFLLFGKKKSAETSPVRQIHAKRTHALSNTKQAELDELCRQLFKKKELITSGKLQFIGLTKIKKKMGKQWAGLCEIVYNTAEEVIDKHLQKGDIFIRYQDDTYVIIFAHASLEEGRIKAGLIAEEIRQRLFTMDEKELRDLEIRNAISQIRTDMFADLDFSGIVDFVATSASSDHPEPDEEDDEPIEIDAIEIEAQHRRVAPTDIKAEPIKLKYNYTPMWDIQRSALTTYLCLTGKENVTAIDFQAYTKLFEGKSPGDITALDQRTLEIVAHDLEEMEKEGRKLLVICPVHHETLYYFDRYELYKEKLSTIPMQHRPFLILLVTDMQEKLIKDPYWFATPARQFCRHVFAEVPLRRDINFSYLKNSGVEGVGVRLDSSLGSEQQVIALLNSFSARAKALKIPKTFALNISTLSLTTSTVCAGFDYIGGTAIHDTVPRPDTIHRYRYEDLLSGLVKKSG